MVRNRLWLAVVLAMVVTGNGSVRGEDEPKPKAPAAAEKEGVAKPSDPFAIPEGNDQKVLSLFLGRLMRVQPKGNTQEAVLEHVLKLEKVADELLSRELEDQMLAQAIGMKYQLFQLRGRFGDKTVEKDQAAFAANSLKDKRPQVLDPAKRFLKMQRIEGIAKLKEGERAALIQQLGKEIQTGELSDEEIPAALTAAEMLSAGNLGDEATAACELFAKKITANGHPEAAKIAKMFEGSGRRLGLMGNEMEISGTTFAGKPFDLASLKGKVVLVDFWATWCGPCRGEIPNMQEQYALYHDKGFEIVGVSVDDDRAALEEFLKEEKLPWIQLHQNDGTGEHANSERYGINGIPACFLIDQSGKVVSLECRGEVLPAMLEKLLGPVEKAPAAPAKVPAEEKK